VVDFRKLLYKSAVERVCSILGGTVVEVQDLRSVAADVTAGAGLPDPATATAPAAVIAGPPPAGLRRAAPSHPRDNPKDEVGSFAFEPPPACTGPCGPHVTRPCRPTCAWGTSSSVPALRPRMPATPPPASSLRPRAAPLSSPRARRPEGASCWECEKVTVETGGVISRCLGHGA
jgi:hypothetical protein